MIETTMIGQSLPPASSRVDSIRHFCLLATMIAGQSNGLLDLPATWTANNQGLPRRPEWCEMRKDWIEMSSVGHCSWHTVEIRVMCLGRIARTRTCGLLLQNRT